MKYIKLICIALSSVLSSAAVVYAEWTPLITSSDFDGPKADVQTFALGLLGILIIVAVVGVLARIIR